MADITPRQTRLFRAPDLRCLQQIIASLSIVEDPVDAGACAVLVPTEAAAGQLRRTLDTIAKARGTGRAGVPVRLPDVVTRTDWYARLHERVDAAPRRLNELEREVLMAAAAREADREGTPPPFHLRPGLIVEIVRMYDDIHRLRRTVDDFERLLGEDLLADAESDRGAAQLLQQTRFLVRAFRGYESRVSALEAVDEHGLRGWLLDLARSQPYACVVVAVADRIAEREGLWPADFDLLTRLPWLARIDVVATEASLAAGFHERLRDVLPGIEETSVRAGLKTRPYHSQEAASRESAHGPEDVREMPVEAGLQTCLESSPPALLVPAADGDERYFRSRDREEELAAIARRLRPAYDRGTPLERTAIVFQRPLPYLYLARRVFESAGLPCQAWDTLPLAAEPYAGAVDLVFDIVSSAFARAAIVALLGSPHFLFAIDGRPIDRGAIAAFDRRMRRAGYLGGLDSLRALMVEDQARQPDPAARLVLEIVEALAPFLETAPASAHLDRLSEFLRHHERPVVADDAWRERRLRARSAVQAAIATLADAHRRIDDREVEFEDVVATVRRWIEGQTFAPRTGAGGLHLLDVQAARFGSFDEVHLVGLVDAEWPDRSPRNVFYPPFLLRHLGWPEEALRLAAVRAAFADLLYLARHQVAVSTFALEDDAIVNPSVFLEDLDREVARGLVCRPLEPFDTMRVFPDEAISEELSETADLVGGGAPGSNRLSLSSGAAEWLALRRSRTDAAAPGFHGMAKPDERASYAVGALETYLECPFKYFAKHVLRLEEEEEREEVSRPKRQGIFLHRVFQAFFEEWGREGGRAIGLDNLDEARAVFARVAAARLDALPEADAALERSRLFGSAAAEGLAEIVLRLEAESDAEIVDRLLEFRLEGEFEIRDGDGPPRRLRLSGVADRIDLLADGTVRVIDYKSSRAPSPRRMLQLPIYSVCATQQLDGRHGRSWKVGEGGYIAFRDPRRFVPLGDADERDEILREAQARLLRAVDGVRRGAFAPTPLEPFRCTFCGYVTVCRKDYVGDE